MPLLRRERAQVRKQGLQQGHHGPQGEGRHRGQAQRAEEKGGQGPAAQAAGSHQHEQATVGPGAGQNSSDVSVLLQLYSNYSLSLQYTKMTQLLIFQLDRSVSVGLQRRSRLQPGDSYILLRGSERALELGQQLQSAQAAGGGCAIMVTC